MRGQSPSADDGNNNEDERRIREALQQLGADRDVHLRYFEAHLTRLPHKAESLHSQRLFLLYLSVTASDMLGASWLPAHRHTPGLADAARCANIAAELRACYDTHTGGFHAVPCATSALPTDGVVTTHCALHTLLICGELNRAVQTWLSVEKTTRYVRRCQRHGDGGFRSAPDVEDVDVRFTYAALMALQLLNISQRLDAQPRLRELLYRGMSYVWRCWRPAEGGFAGAPHGAEVHGGMTYCAVAALALAGAAGHTSRPRCWLQRLHGYVARRLSRSGEADEDKDDSANENNDVVLGWCDCVAWSSADFDKSSGVATQADAVLGFQGRPAKPCDSCYTHWLGGVLGILLFREVPLFTSSTSDSAAAMPLPVNVVPLLKFVHACRRESGGFGRHIGAPSDLVHSCFGLSGALLMVHLALSELQGLAPCSGTQHELWQQLQLSPPHPVLGCSLRTARLHGMVC